MHRRHHTRTTARLCAVAVTATVALLAPSGPAQAAAGTRYSAPLRTAVGDLPVAAESRSGYSRDLFTHWVDEDGDGCDTRKEVLIAEAVVTPTIGSGCSISGGRWYSYYDAATWTQTGDLDIDHLVPLAEAWDSGASGWTASQRRTYANDLGDDRDLAAVTDSVNQSKSDQDPAEWMPTHETCRYVAEWVAVKIRWRLTVDASERSALTSLAGSCTDSTVSVVRAV